MPARRSPTSLTFASLLLALAVAAGCGEDSEDGSASVPNDDAARSWTLRQWEGELTQEGMKPFRVWATVGSLRRADANSVRYSGLDCRGRWTPLGGDAETYRFRERITSGRSAKCKGVGTVTLRRLADDRAAYAFRGGGVESRGVLSNRAVP